MVWFSALLWRRFSMLAEGGWTTRAVTSGRVIFYERGQMDKMCLLLVGTPTCKKESINGG